MLRLPSWGLRGDRRPSLRGDTALPQGTPAALGATHYQSNTEVGGGGGLVTKGSHVDSLQVPDRA